MVTVRIDGKGGSVFDTRKEAEDELRMWGFRPEFVGGGWEKLLFTGKECKTMTARIIEEVA